MTGHPTGSGEERLMNQFNGANQLFWLCREIATSGPDDFPTHTTVWTDKENDVLVSVFNEYKNITYF